MGDAQPCSMAARARQLEALARRPSCCVYCFRRRRPRLGPRPTRCQACDDAAESRRAAWTRERTAPAGPARTRAPVARPASPIRTGCLRDGTRCGRRDRACSDAAPDGVVRGVAVSSRRPARRSSRASITRDIGNRDEWTPYGRIDGADLAGETCIPGVGEAFCRITGTRTFSGLNATTVAYSFRCVVAPFCAHGATLRARVGSGSRGYGHARGSGGWGWFLVLTSGRGVGGPARGRWLISAGDNTGVRRRLVVVDGVSRVVVDAPGASAGGCGEPGRGVAYSFSRPCADSRGLNGLRSISIQPCSWGDGAHSVRGVAVDTGGLEASSPTAATVRVDCTPPVCLGRRAGTGRGRGAAAMKQAVFSGDATSGVDRVNVGVSVAGGAWGSAGDVARRGRAELRVPGPGCRRRRELVGVGRERGGCVACLGAGGALSRQPVVPEAEVVAPCRPRPRSSCRRSRVSLPDAAQPPAEGETGAEPASTTDDRRRLRGRRGLP